VNSAFLQSTSKFRLDPANAGSFFGADASGFVEEVGFSDELTKINRKGRRQTRCIVVTNLALFNYKLGKYKSFQRRISLFNLDKVGGLVPLLLTGGLGTCPGRVVGCAIRTSGMLG
jgi:hypothetical protein